jgi:hypothetical protein
VRVFASGERGYVLGRQVIWPNQGGATNMASNLARPLVDNRDFGVGDSHYVNDLTLREFRYGDHMRGRASGT